VVVPDPALKPSGAELGAPGGAPQPSRLLEVPAERLLEDWKEAHERAHAYLAALGVPAHERPALVALAIERALAVAWDEGSDAVSETLRALRQIMPGREPRRGPPLEGDPFLAWRLDRALAGRMPDAEGSARPETVGFRDGVFCATPGLSRRSMIPERIERGLFRRLLGERRAGGPGTGPSPRPLYGSPLRQLRRRLPWTRVAHRRRTFLMILVLIPSVVASGFMANVLPHKGGTWLEVAIMIFFGALFGWISIGFWTALLGFWTLARGRDRFAITSLDHPDTAPPVEALSLPTAVVMPICNEPVDRVFAGLKAIHRSLQRAGSFDRFHIFVLSDTSDPDAAMREEEAWFRWCREVDGFDRIFYRRRKVRLARKSGNVADFCRRWGRLYRYMIMLDADSIMSGDTLVRLVGLMDRHPNVGMIQTAPTAVNRRSLFARVQQFASRVYGPMFAAGLHFWQLGDGQYWGHNAIIRVEPFMDHCALPRLPGKAPLGGEILSHDFVEAALLGRHGWTLWLAYALGGSYEEVPSTLLEEMKRDRRWCQGNLQHMRLLFTEGLFGAHRALFLNGAMSYVSALLWNGFLALSTIEAIRDAIWQPEYFPHGPSLFPEWPVWRLDWALWLLAVIGLLLFLPKALSIVLVWLRAPHVRLYGGVFRLTLSVLLEILMSSLMAPIRMVFHSRFVMMNLIGRTVSWSSQDRDETDTTWPEAVRHHGVDTLVATAWGTLLFWLNPGYFWWVTPIIGALILSVPVSVFASRVRPGDVARRMGLFLIPEEAEPPPELRDLHALLGDARAWAKRMPAPERDGFVRVAVDPFANAVHRALLGHRRSLLARIRARREALLARALADGPGSLAPPERRMLLMDPAVTDALHERLWALPDRVSAARWGRPGAPPPAASDEARGVPTSA
jgi:membrane glycosyltransferase